MGRRRSGYGSYWHEFYPPSKPRQARGGIKAQSRGSAFGNSWWARRWITVLESFQIGGRLSRGRSYARRGQVLSISIEQGAVAAQVQGSRPAPYRVRIELSALKAAESTRVVEALSQQAVFAAKLLAGEMPQDVEQAFEAAGVSLFPKKLKDLRTSCSCPDWSNPCKHVAAVYYLIGEEFDRDPFLIFKLRGLPRDELLRSLGGAAEAPAASPSRRRTKGTKTKQRAGQAVTRPAEPAKRCRPAPRPSGRGAVSPLISPVPFDSRPFRLRCLVV